MPLAGGPRRARPWQRQGHHDGCHARDPAGPSGKPPQAARRSRDHRLPFSAPAATTTATAATATAAAEAAATAAAREIAATATARSAARLPAAEVRLLRAGAATVHVALRALPAAYALEGVVPACPAARAHVTPATVRAEAAVAGLAITGLRAVTRAALTVAPLASTLPVAPLPVTRLPVTAIR
jgi:hypothetical protein